MNNFFKYVDFFQLESQFWVANKTQHIPAYDFMFESFFEVKRPRNDQEVSIIARMGPLADYELTYSAFLDIGFKLIHTPEQHRLISELENWYPPLKDLTPKSRVFAQFPLFKDLQDDFTFPLFIKGNRQTAKHDASLSIARDPDEFEKIRKAYQLNSILHWQKVAIREYVPLAPLSKTVVHKLPLSYEFRTFWWKGQCVGSGNYWSQYVDYQWTPNEEREALKVAQLAALRLQADFIAIDLAFTQKGEWIIIECNDAQESGYCGVNPVRLWRKILEIEKNAHS